MEVSGVEDADTLMLRGHPKPGDSLKPNTRASDVAVYLDAWRRKIEKTGTENYPMAALNREGLSGNPVLEVQILPDGKLGEVILKRSSGHPELDKAALGILHLAAPFDPFPSSLLAEHPALRLSYEWQFRGGQLRPSSQ
jgi:protein TonB